MAIKDYASFVFRQDWSEWFKPKNYNYLQFKPILMEIEFDKIDGSLQIELMLLGVGFGIFIAVRDPSELFMNALKEVADKVAEEKP